MLPLEVTEEEAESMYFSYERMCENCGVVPQKKEAWLNLVSAVIVVLPNQQESEVSSNQQQVTMTLPDGTKVTGTVEAVRPNVASNVEIERSKDVLQIVIPQKMSLKEGAEWLLKKDKEEDKKVAIHHEFDCFPLDGAVALRDSLAEIYGFVEGVDIPGGWFAPDQPPVMVGVPIGNGKVKQVPWGRVCIPGVAGYLETSMDSDPHPRFILVGETKQRHLHEIESLVEKIKARLKTHSIYKGKAIRLDLSWMRDDEDFDPLAHAPTFTIPVDEIREEDLIFTAKVQNDIDLGLFTPIEHSEHCRKHQIPLKRGVLLAGHFGVGKSLTAYVTAKKAVRHGWTFVYLSSAMDLEAGFKFAAQYAPAVVFVEDVDRVIGTEQRTEEIDAILNAFDGVDTKNLELITVLTTNHLEKLNQAILRQGRCDTLVQVTRPDADAASRLVKLYGRGLVADDADFDRIGKALADHLPAEIREAVERAKLAAIRRLTASGELQSGGTIAGHVREMDVMAAVHAMEAQHKLLEPKKKSGVTIAEKCAEALGDRIGKAVSQGAREGTGVMVNLLQQLGVAKVEIFQALKTLDANDDVPAESVEFTSRVNGN